jgi:glycosyltransferase involved in cell wall biosynthesis
VNIGIDVRPLQNDHRFRGVGVYLRHLLEALAEIDTSNEYVLFALPGDSPVADLNMAGLKHSVVTLPRPSPRQTVDRLRNAVRPVLRARPTPLDAFLQPDAAYGWPASGSGRRVVVAYDMIELIFAERYFPRAATLLRDGPARLAGNRVRRWLLSRSLRTMRGADAVVAISECTKRDVSTLAGVPAALISVTPLAAAPVFTPSPDAAVVSRFGVRSPYLLFVGGVDFRKNVPAALRAFELVKPAHPDVTLVLVGQGFDAMSSVPEHLATRTQIAASAYASDITLAGYVPDDELRALYSSAAALVFPSLYEGFGMPALEAMACGCPVIALDNSSLPEVMGDAGILVGDEAGLAPSIDSLLRDPGKQAEMRRAGLRRAAEFSWTKTAERTLKVLTAAA